MVFKPIVTLEIGNFDDQYNSLILVLYSLNVICKSWQHHTCNYEQRFQIYHNTLIALKQIILFLIMLKF